MAQAVEQIKITIALVKCIFRLLARGDVTIVHDDGVHARLIQQIGGGGFHPAPRAVCVP